MQNTKHTEIIPLKYAVIFLVISLAALVFLSNPTPAQSENLDLDAIADTMQTTVVTYPMNPLMIQDLSADMHSSEELIPQVPPEPVASLRIKPATTTTTIPLPNGDCSQWYSVALEAGWEYDQLTKLGRIIFKESSCQHDVANKTYSYGLTQIEWSAHKNWLQSEFGITEREELYDPYTNLLVARWLYDYADEHYGCGWQPWYMSGNWC